MGIKKAFSRDLPLSPLMIFGAIFFCGLYWLDSNTEPNPRAIVTDWTRIRASKREIYCTSQLLGRMYKYHLHAKFEYIVNGRKYSGQGYSILPASFREMRQCELRAAELSAEPPMIFVSQSQPDVAVVEVVAPDRSNIYWGYGFFVLMFLSGVLHVILRRRKVRRR